jgi:HEAT repeat protein
VTRRRRLARVVRLAPLGALLALVAAGCGGGLDSPVPERRAAAVRDLSRAGAERAIPALLVAQHDASPMVRLAAAETLTARKGAQAAPALGAMLADPDPGVVGAAAHGLARIGDLAAARTALTEGYATASPAGRLAIADAMVECGVSLRDGVEAEARHLWKRNVTVLAAGTAAARAGAAEELGASGKAEAVARLAAIAQRPDEDPSVVAAALRGLGEASDPAVRPLLEKAVESPQPDVALAGAHALGRLGDPAGMAPLARLAAAGGGPLHLAAFDALESLPVAPDVSRALCGVALRNPIPALAARAARDAWTRNADCSPAAFAARAGRGEAAALAAVVELHPDAPTVAALAARLLPVAGDARGSAEVRARAAVALARMDWAAAAAVLEPRARELSARLARGAGPAEAGELGALLSALGRLRATAAADLLLAGCAAAAPAVRAGAVEGIAFLGGDGIPRALTAALTDPDPAVRSAALAGLPRYGPAAVPPLRALAVGPSSGDAAWQAAIARALGQTGAREALDPLAALLRGAAPAAAAGAIAALGLSEGADPLVAHLARRDAPGRVEVLEALAQLAARGSGAAFEPELLSERPEVRAAAARAVGRLRYEPASARLEALRVDYDGRVRRAAIEALAKLPSGRPVGR